MAAERGFSLLRDRRALARFLRVAMKDDLDATRITLPLGPGDAVARLVVTRDGQGVTCLAPHMASSAPSVPWRLVERFLEGIARLFRARVQVQREAEGTRATSLSRVVRQPWRLVNDDLQALEDIAPIFIERAKDQLLYALEAIELLRKLPAVPKAVALESMWTLYVGAAHWLIACRREPRVVPLAYATLIGANDVHLAARALFTLVADPEQTLTHTPRIAGDNEHIVFTACRYVLPGIAFRHPARAREAARLAKELLERVPAEGGEEVIEVIRSLADGEEARRNVLAIVESAEEGGTGAWRPLAELGAPPRLAPRPHLDDGERADVAAWRHFFSRRTLPLLLTDDATTPLLAALAPFEAFLPGEAPDADWRRSAGVEYVRRTLTPMVRRASSSEAPAAPRRAAKAPGRNEPCPCGSGRKFKHCHGAR